MNEYIIINKTDLEKRIEELETIEAMLINEGMRYTATRAKIDELYSILHLSTPLIPVLEQETLIELPSDEEIEKQSEYIAHNYFDMNNTNHYKGLEEGAKRMAYWMRDKILKNK